MSADLWLLNSCTVKTPSEDGLRNSITSAHSLGKLFTFLPFRGNIEIFLINYKLDSNFSHCCRVRYLSLLLNTNKQG